MSQELFQLQDDEVIICKDNKTYQDSYEHFIIDYGRKLPQYEYTNTHIHSVQAETKDLFYAIYNKTLRQKVINGEMREFLQDEIFGDIIDNIDEFLAKQAERQPKPEQVEPTLEERKAAKLIEIDEMTKKEITGGFTSAAKGTEHIYDSAEVDQLTFSAMYAASKSPDFEATEPYYGQIPIRAVPAGENEKAIVKHNAAEMQKVIDDLALHIGKCKQIGWRLQEQAKAAKNQSDLDKIVRPS